MLTSNRRVFVENKTLCFLFISTNRFPTLRLLGYFIVRFFWCCALELRFSRFSFVRISIFQRPKVQVHIVYALCLSYRYPGWNPFCCIFLINGSFPRHRFIIPYSWNWLFWFLPTFFDKKVRITWSHLVFAPRIIISISGSGQQLDNSGFIWLLNQNLKKNNSNFIIIYSYIYR